MRTPRPTVVLIAAVAAVALSLATWAPVQAQAVAVYSTLAALTQGVGDPPLATYGRLRIASLGVDAAIGRRAVTWDDGMPMPYGPADVAWYDWSQFEGFGGEPGAGGNAIFAGHVNFGAMVPYAGVRYNGEGVFYRLGDLRAGDVIDVTRGGEVYRYQVTWKRSLEAHSADWASVWSARVPVDSITLFTCTGDWDAVAREFSHRLVVRAERIQGTPARVAIISGERVGYGLAGTSSPVLLADAQTYPVAAIYGFEPSTGRWLVYRPGAPDFVNTLAGRLRPDWVVMIQRAD